jgi:hypothetical protein
MPVPRLGRVRLVVIPIRQEGEWIDLTLLDDTQLAIAAAPAANTGMGPTEGMQVDQIDLKDIAQQKAADKIFEEWLASQPPALPGGYIGGT